MERTTEFSIEIETTESYMDLSFSRAPKKNHDALAQLGKQYVQWLKKHGVRGEIYYLDTHGSATTSNEIPPEGVESIIKILRIGEEEELWVALQFYRDKAHADQVRSKMMQDETVSEIMKEFDDLVTPGKNMITDGFSRLRT
jgi:large subunit ribosomal protein L17